MDYFTKEEQEQIISMYNQDISIRQIAISINKSRYKISEFIKSFGYNPKEKPPINKIKQEDIDFLQEHYPNGEWDILFKHFNTNKKSNIQGIASRYNISSNYCNKWTDEEDELLLQNMYNMEWKDIKLLLPNRTIEAINNHAQRLGYKHDVLWSDEEVEMLKLNYETHSLEEICEMFPHRKRLAITAKANQLNLERYDSIYWDTSDDDYIINNWELLSDYELAEQLHRTFRSVKWRRQQLGLYRRDNIEKNTKI